MIHQYRKKPVVIQAFEWTGDAMAFSQWLSAVDHPRPDPLARDREFQFQGSRLAIVTLEGVMHAEPGDMVIRGVQGEFYPCKPDIFDATYAELGSAPTPCQHVDAIERALHELGVPQPGYPAPVANAVEILRASLGMPPA